MLALLISDYLNLSSTVRVPRPGQLANFKLTDNSQVFSWPSQPEPKRLRRKIEEAMSVALVCDNFSPVPSKISFHMEKQVTRCGPISTKHSTFLTLELSQYRKSGSTFSSSEPVAARCDCRRLGTAQAVPAPRALPLDLHLNLRLSSRIAFWSDCQMTGKGLNLNSNWNSATWPTGCNGFVCSEIPK